MERVEILIDNKILNDVERNCNGNRSEFIRTAIEEKLSRKKSDDNDILRILKQIERLDPNAMHDDIRNMLISLTNIFGETQKQNQILKLILRRATLASRFGAVNLENIVSDDKFEEIEKEVTRLVNSEIHNVNI